MEKESEQTLNLHGLSLVVLVGGELAGIVLGSWLPLPQPFWLIAALLTLLPTSIFWRQPLTRYALLMLFCLCLGGWRYMAASSPNEAGAIGTFIGRQTVSIQGEIIDEPDLGSNSTLLRVATQSLSLDNGQTWQQTHGEIQVEIRGSTFDDPFGPHYGDTLQLTGKLDAPSTYATKGLQASMAFPGVYLKERGGNPLLALLYQWRTGLASILMQALPQPFASVLIALFLSLRTPALRDILPLFAVTGTAHLLAAGGFKVTLLAGLISRRTTWLAPRKQEMHPHLLPAQRRRDNWKRWLHIAPTILCIALYTFLSGGGPAALRAGLMGTLLALAPLLQRRYNVYTALALAALLMSAINPFLLWDVGFQLSFVGTLGIVLFTPFLQRQLRFLAHLPLGEHIAEIMAVTLAAQIATLPIFALSFKQISFIAPLANVATMPLLGVLITLGALICLSGWLFLPLATLGGWLAWPLLWYINSVISWCAKLPGAYLQVDTLNPLLAWIYYALLAWLTALLFTHWKASALARQSSPPPLLSHAQKRVVQVSLALLILLITGTLSLSTPSDGRLTLTLLTDNDSTQGKALLLRSPDGEVALINEGANSVTLAHSLDSRLPLWQRSLHLVILPSASANNLSGLQDVTSRYQISQTIDAGMLHPSTAYARWRMTLDERHLPYTRVHQGALISLGNQVRFEVLWPLSQLHKSSNEESDNALIVRLVSPRLRVLFVNAAALSEYALKTLLATFPPDALRADIVQLSGDAHRTLPASLSELLPLAHPSLLFVTSTSSSRSTRAPATEPPGTTLATLTAGPWRVVQAQDVDSLEISSTIHGWDFHF